jgi:hypothetical protein
MARKSNKGGLKGLGPNYPPEFLSPLNAPRTGDEPGPDVANAPLLSSRDPLGLVPGGDTGKPAHGHGTTKR